MPKSQFNRTLAYEDVPTGGSIMVFDESRYSLYYRHVRRLHYTSGVLYLIMMVLMPFLHLSFGRHEEAGGNAPACCAHTQPEGRASQDTEHDPDNCSICNLLLLASEPVKVYPAITFSPFLIRTAPCPDHRHEAPTIKIRSARDPPAVQTAYCSGD